MLRFAAVALLVGLALPACAQRGGGGFHGGGGGLHGGGFASHTGSAGGFRGGFSAPRFSAPRSFSRFSPSRPYGSFAHTPRYARPLGYARPYGYRSPYNAYRNPRYSQGFHSYGRRPGYRRGRRDRFRGRVFFGFAPPLYYYVPDWIGLGTLGCYPDASINYYDGYDDFDCGNMQFDDQDQYRDQGENQDQPQVYGNDDDNGYGSVPPPPPPDQPRYEPPAYHQPASPSLQMPSSQIAANQTTTIFFNNGQAPEQIHDYALTGTTLYVLGQHQQEIPLSQIDLAKTEQTNRNAGIEFQVPEYQITQ